MESYLINGYKIFFASFPKGDPANDEILKFHLRQYQKYMFEIADTVKINGEEISNFERMLILGSTKQVEGECMVYGEPDEMLFIEDKIHNLEKVKLELPGNLKVKADSYLKFLFKRKTELFKVPKKQLAFEELFKDKSNAKKVKEIFEMRGYTINEKWQGLTKNKSELLAAYYVLMPLLNPNKPTTGARIFYNEFGLTVGSEKDGNYITERMLTNEPFNPIRGEFEMIFSVLLSSIQK
jgi:hypothetical protein